MPFFFTLKIVMFFSCTVCIYSEDYIVDTSDCKIPNIEPFNNDFAKIMKPLPPIHCNGTELFTYVTKINNSAVLHIRQDLVSRYYPHSFYCCYSYVTRSGTLENPDVGIHISPCNYFQNKLVLLHEIVMVKCSVYDDLLNHKLVYENVHYPIVVKDQLKARMNNNSLKPLSVLFIVVDSVSRLNFIRTMHQTYQYLFDNDFIEMKGYTKIDDNTFPNFMALLTGFNLTQSNKICSPIKVNKLDTCPMIWYDYRTLGYITAYAEDDSYLTTFNYRKKGFNRPPTDYYFKSYFEAAENLTVTNIFKMPYCTGPESSGERVLKLAQDFTITFKNQSTFGIFWMNTFSHNDLNMPYTMDDKMKQFFVNIKNEGVLDESIVFFLSDHGIRFGRGRATPSGWFEERMPINMISVPNKFKNQFKKEFENLKENSNKLVNTYDLYMTLQHILSLSGLNYNIKPSSACSKCDSLFRKILNRSCKDASVSPEWCPCIGGFSPIEDEHELVRNATFIALNKIKESLVLQPQNRFEEYVLIRILSASISEVVNIQGSTYLFVAFRTRPAATFLTTVIFQQFINTNSTFYIRRHDNAVIV